MAGLGLTNALQSYQQGVAWRQQQDQIAEQKAKKDKINAANQAGSSYIEEAKQAHEAEQASALEKYTKDKGSTEGFQATPFRPNDRVMFGAAARRGDALLNAGLFDEYAQNRAAIIPMQIQSRQAAWQKFQTDGDHGALGAAMYDTIPDGKHVKAYDVLDSAGPDGKKAGKKIRFQLDDGTVKMFSPEEVENMAKRAAMNPQELAKVEFERDLIAAKAREARALEELKGEQDRKTEKVKGSERRGLAAIVADREDARSAADRASAEKRTGISAKATVDAATIRSTAEKEPKQPSDNEIRDAVVERFGTKDRASLTGKRGMTQLANDIVLDVREILLANPKADLTRAIAAAAKLRNATVTDGED